MNATKRSLLCWVSPHLGLQLEVSFEFEKAQVLPAAGYATLTRDYAILPMLGRSYWPMLATEVGARVPWCPMMKIVV